MATPTTISLTASPSTLQHLATLKTAMSLLEHRIGHEKPKNLLHLQKPLPVDQVPLPEVLRKRLLTYTESMTDKIWDWTSFHSNYIFTEKSRSYPLLFLDHLVWYDDGIIDYCATAKNLLQDAALSDLEKFSIAKLYFFIDFVTEKYPHVAKDQLKTWLTPSQIFNTLKAIAHQVSGYNLLRIHKRMAEFLNWYFSDTAAIILFTSPRLMAVQGSSDEILVRTLLLGLGYRVPLPV